MGVPQDICLAPPGPLTTPLTNLFSGIGKSPINWAFFVAGSVSRRERQRPPNSRKHKDRGLFARSVATKSCYETGYEHGTAKGDVAASKDGDSLGSQGCP